MNLCDGCDMDCDCGANALDGVDCGCAGCEAGRDGCAACRCCCTCPEEAERESDAGPQSGDAERPAALNLSPRMRAE